MRPVARCLEPPTEPRSDRKQSHSLSATTEKAKHRRVERDDVLARRAMPSLRDCHSFSVGNHTPEFLCDEQMELVGVGAPDDQNGHAQSAHLIFRQIREWIRGRSHRLEEARILQNRSPSLGWQTVEGPDSVERVDEDSHRRFVIPRNERLPDLPLDRRHEFAEERRTATGVRHPSMNRRLRQNQAPD